MRGSATSLTYCPRPCVRRCKFGRGTDRPIYEFGRSSAVRMGGESSAIFIGAGTLQKTRRPKNCAPHMRRRAVVEPEPFFRLLEITPDDVDEVVETDFSVGIERIDIVHADEPRGHVPFVRSGTLVLLHDVRLRLVVGPEQFLVEIGIAVSDRFVREKAKGLVCLN